MRDQKSIIYSDSDGVLADFEAAAIMVLGRPWDATQGDRREKGDKINSYPHFWETIPVMRDFHVLWEFIEKYHPHILTAVPSDPWRFSRREVEAGKREWYRRHIPSLPQSRIHVVDREDKAKYATNGKTRNILIDDHVKNVREFESAGGIGVLHHNAKTTIIQLRLLGYH